MSPLGIDILLWYYTRAVDYRDGDFSAPAVREAIDHFRDNAGLLEPRTAGDGDWRSYRLTERGEVYVAALTSLPLPERVCRWVIPDSETPAQPEAPSGARLGGGPES